MSTGVAMKAFYHLQLNCTVTFKNCLESRDPCSVIHLCIPSTAWKDGGFGYRAGRREGIPGGEVVWAKAQR